MVHRGNSKSNTNPSVHTVDMFLNWVSASAVSAGRWCQQTSCSSQPWAPPLHLEKPRFCPMKNNGEKWSLQRATTNPFHPVISIGTSGSNMHCSEVHLASWCCTYKDWRFGYEMISSRHTSSSWFLVFDKFCHIERSCQLCTYSPFYTVRSCSVLRNRASGLYNRKSLDCQ